MPLPWSIISIANWTVIWLHQKHILYHLTTNFTFHSDSTGIWNHWNLEFPSWYSSKSLRSARSRGMKLTSAWPRGEKKALAIAVNEPSAAPNAERHLVTEVGKKYWFTWYDIWYDIDFHDISLYTFFHTPIKDARWHVFGKKKTSTRTWCSNGLLKPPTLSIRRR